MEKHRLYFYKRCFRVQKKHEKKKDPSFTRSIIMKKGIIEADLGVASVLAYEMARRGKGWFDHGGDESVQGIEKNETER